MKWFGIRFSRPINRVEMNYKAACLNYGMKLPKVKQAMLKKAIRKRLRPKYKPIVRYPRPKPRVRYKLTTVRTQYCGYLYVEWR